jgi:hypothetical protein
MSATKLMIGEKFFHSAMNKLIPCRDEHYNNVYNEDELQLHNKAKIKLFVIAGSDSSKFLEKNEWKEFEVIHAQYGGGGTGMGQNDVYPNAWQVYCCPVGHPEIRIKFHQASTYNHNIPKVKLLLKNA